MNIVQKYGNAYRFTYMGESELNVPGYKIVPGVTFEVPDDRVHLILNNVHPDELDNFIYEKILSIK